MTNEKENSDLDDNSIDKGLLDTKEWYSLDEVFDAMFLEIDRMYEEGLFSDSPNKKSC